MRETLRDWKRDWIEANGEIDDIEVLISEGEDSFYNPYMLNGMPKMVHRSTKGFDRKGYSAGKTSFRCARL